MEQLSKRNGYIDAAGTFLLWAMAIFYFFVISSYSAQTAEVSTLESKALVEKSLSVVKNAAAALSKNESPKVSYTMMVRIVRKSAHLLNFSILGFLYCMVAYRTNISKIKCVLRAACVCGFFAASIDELHQYFVPGRSAGFSDVLLDFAGVCIGCLLFVLGMYCVLRSKNSHGRVNQHE